MIGPRSVITLVALAACLAGCGSAGGASPQACERALKLQIGDGRPTPVCSISMALSALGGTVTLQVDVALPPSGPYGSDSEQARLIVRSFALGTPAERTTGMLYTGGRGVGPIIGAAGPTSSGSCDLDRKSNALEIGCDLQGLQGDRLALTGRLPAAPDPRSDPHIEWIEATYVFEGDYLASAVVTSAVGAGEMQLGSFGVLLADGSLVTVVPNGNVEGRVAWITVADPAAPLDLQPAWLPDEITPSLGACVATVANEPLTGSLHCPGDPDSATGSATLEMAWRPAP